MSKIYITTDPETNNVMFTHYMPFDQKEGLGKTESELKETGFLIDSIPQPEHREGYYAVAKYTMQKGYYYEYKEIPPAPPAPEDEMEKRIKTLEGAVQELIINQYGK